jgi:hypothetical protein
VFPFPVRKEILKEGLVNEREVKFVKRKLIIFL